MHGYPNPMTTVGGKPIRSRVILFDIRPRKICPKDNETYADTVVPERNIVLLPLEARMDLRGCGDELVKIVDDSVGFSFGNADNVCHKARVEEYRFPPCD